MSGGAAAFSALGVTKTFPGVVALSDVSIRLAAGSIHALLGENGAGKSTLIKVITGVHVADKGRLLIGDEPVDLHGAHHAAQLGVSVVHQERHLIPRFSIGENILLDRLGPHAISPINFRAVHAEAAKWLAVLGLDLDPRQPVEGLSVARMQGVEIAKALSHRSKVLLLDEPTSSLTPHETATLFTVLRQLRDTGVAIVFVSHKLEEVLEICDAVTVLRDGSNACPSRPLAGLGRADLVQLMIGRAERIPDLGARREPTADPPALELRDVATADGHAAINLRLRRGEILGLYGLVGAGRTELARAIIGRTRVTAGEIRVKGAPARIDNVRTARDRYRIGYVSEDRKGEGLILIHSVLENAGIAVWRRLAARFGRLTRARVHAAVEPVIRRLEVRTPSLDQTIGNLSGGNQQKVSLAKWLAADAEVLIVDEPTVGIDIKTKAYFHALLRELADRGAAILLITSDMPEMITLADRIAVMNGFRIMGETTNDRDYGRMSARIMALIHDAEAPDGRAA
jgi:ribose transport system ATP-binding protein